MNKKLSTSQKIEISREIRMWVTRVIIPAIGGALYLDYKYPQLKTNIRDHICNKFKKEEKENMR